jgi:tyrosine-protein kinase Etk/Wzc
MRSLLLVAAVADPDLADSPVRLARALTDNGLRVLLVEADRRGGTIDKAFGLTGRPGLEDIIGGVAGVRPVQPEPQLYVLPSGTPSGTSPRAFTPGILRSLVDSASQWADLVVVHTPVGVDEPDTLRLAGSTDGVVVGTHGVGADRNEVQRAVALLDGVGARIVGLLTVGARGRLGAMRRGSAKH